MVVLHDGFVMASQVDNMGIMRRVVVGLKRHEGKDVMKLAKFTDCIVDYFAPNEISVKVSCTLQDNTLLLCQSSQSIESAVNRGIDSKEGCDLGSVILQHSPQCPVRRLPECLDHEPIPEITLNRGVYVGIAVVIESSDGHILLTQRSDHMRAFPRAWVPPGGHLEIGESIIEGGLRELEEETGLKFCGDTCDTRVLCLWESVYPVLLGMGSPKNHHIVVYLHTKSIETSEQLRMKMKLDPGEVQACIWLSADDVRRLFARGEERSKIINKYLPGPDELVTHSSQLNLSEMFPKTLWQEEHIYSGTQLALRRWLYYYCNRDGGVPICKI